MIYFLYLNTNIIKCKFSSLPLYQYPGSNLQSVPGYRKRRQRCNQLQLYFIIINTNHFITNCNINIITFIIKIILILMLLLIIILMLLILIILTLIIVLAAQ